jgi:hypothetical protein
MRVSAIVDALADVRLLGGGAQRFPARGLGHPEDIDLAVVVAVFEFCRDQFGGVEMVIVVGVGKAPRQFGTPRGEGVGDVLDEDQPEDQVLVFGGVHVGAQLVGGRPQGLLDVVEHGVASAVGWSSYRLCIGEPGWTHFGGKSAPDIGRERCRPARCQHRRTPVNDLPAGFTDLDVRDMQ